MAVNDNYLIAPWADVCYFADAKWWSWHKRRPELGAFEGQKCSIFDSGNAIHDPGVHIVRNAGTDGLSLDPGALCTGSNSGYQAVNLAVLAGARRILLLGYDGKAGPSGQKHWFGEHPDRSEAPYGSMTSRFQTMVEPLKSLGVEVINCSPGSAIKCFPMGRIDEALA